MAAGADTGFRCKCGALYGTLDLSPPAAGTHVVCHCRDCRAAELYLGQPDPAPEGVHIFQTTPDRVHIAGGAEHLGLLRLGPKGLFRWYATCCSTPMFNSLPRPAVPFAAVLAARLERPEKLGRARVEAFIPKPDGSHRHRGIALSAWGILRRGLAARMSGRWRDTPFFDLETGAPVAEPRVLSREERAAVTRP